jgi:hypothetical protein
VPEIKYQPLFTQPRQRGAAPQSLQTQMLAQALKQSGSSEPIFGPAAGAAKMALGGITGWTIGQEQRAAEEKQQRERQNTLSALRTYGEKNGFTPEVMGLINTDPTMGQSLVAAQLAARIQPPLRKSARRRPPVCGQERPNTTTS